MRHLWTAHTTLAKHERGDASREERLSFQGVCTDACILGQDYPTPCPDFSKPINIGRIIRK